MGLEVLHLCWLIAVRELLIFKPDPSEKGRTDAKTLYSGWWYSSQGWFWISSSIILALSMFVRSQG